MTRTTRRTVSLIVIILLGLWLRLLWLGVSPLRGDEAFAIEYWAAPWPEGLAITSIEPHPYGTFALFALWKSIFGDGEWVMRLLPTLFSIPGIAATYTLGRRLAIHDRAAQLAALLYALHPFLIWHAQDARNYAIWAALSPIVMIAFLRALDTNRLRDWGIYAGIALASAYTFFFAIFFLATQGVYLLLTRPARLRRYLMAASILAIGLIPWALQILGIMQGGDYGGTAGEFQFSQLFTWFLPTFAAGSTLPPNINTWLWPALVLLFAGGLIGLWRGNRPAAVFLLLNVAIPVLGLWAASGRMDIFRPRYLLPVSVVLLLVVAWVVHNLTTRSYRPYKIAGILLLGGILLLDGTAIVNSHLNPAFAKAPDWRALGSFLTAHVAPDDLVIQQALDPGFTYYYRGPADETGLPLRANPPAEETIALLEEAVARYAAIWLLPVNMPSWDAERVPLTWLTANLQTTANLTLADFDVLEYRTWTVPSAELATCRAIEFAAVAYLCDWQIERLGPDVLRVTLYWEPLQPTPDPLLHGFAHLTGPPHGELNSPLWAQDDHAVTDTHWQPGVVRRDVYQIHIPPNLPSGQWAVEIGLYDPQTAARIAVGSEDHVILEMDSALLNLDTQ